MKRDWLKSHFTMSLRKTDNSLPINISTLLLLFFIRSVENELQKIDKILERLEGKSATGYESWHRAQAVQKQRDNKVHMITRSLTLKHSHNFIH